MNLSLWDNEKAMIGFGRIVLIYFMCGVASQIWAPAIVSEQQEIMGINATESSLPINTGSMSAAEMAASMPDDPSQGQGIIASGASLILGGLTAAWPAVLLALNVVGWPAVVFSGFGLIGIGVGWFFTFMFWVAFFLWVRGVA